MKQSEKRQQNSLSKISEGQQREEALQKECQSLKNELKEKNATEHFRFKAAAEKSHRDIE